MTRSFRRRERHASDHVSTTPRQNRLRRATGTPGCVLDTFADIAGLAAALTRAGLVEREALVLLDDTMALAAVICDPPAELGWMIDSIELPGATFTQVVDIVVEERAACRPAITASMNGTGEVTDADDTGHADDVTGAAQLMCDRAVQYAALRRVLAGQGLGLCDVIFVGPDGGDPVGMASACDAEPAWRPDRPQPPQDRPRN